jgi:hypothetical protein
MLKVCPLTRLLTLFCPSRCICLTYTDYPEVDSSRPADFLEDPDLTDNNLTILAITGIKASYCSRCLPPFLRLLQSTELL